MVVEVFMLQDKACYAYNVIGNGDCLFAAVAHQRPKSCLIVARMFECKLEVVYDSGLTTMFASANERQFRLMFSGPNGVQNHYDNFARYDSLSTVTPKGVLLDVKNAQFVYINEGKCKVQA